MVNKDTIEFLNALKENNTREWFQSNKTWYDSSLANFKQIVTQLIPAIASFDKDIAVVEPAECIFRIYRDIRFSPDKTPYKTHFGAYISPGGRKSIYAGYYFHIEPQASLMAGGVYLPEPDILKRIRQEIVENIDEFLEIINHPDFIKYFGAIDGRKLKKCPIGFPSDFKYIDLLCLKDYNMLHSIDNKGIFSMKTIENFLNIFHAMHPLNQFINKAIKH